jgi:hypothetical protein
MAEDKIVHDHGFMPGEAKEPDAVAADVPGTAGDENFHGWGTESREPGERKAESAWTKRFRNSEKLLILNIFKVI